MGDAIAIFEPSPRQNIALVEESPATAESLSKQAQELVSLVHIFKLEKA